MPGIVERLCLFVRTLKGCVRTNETNAPDVRTKPRTKSGQPVIQPSIEQQFFRLAQFLVTKFALVWPAAEVPALLDSHRTR